MKTYPLISVVIPCYNYGKYVEDAIDSCLNSTWGNIEIIVVNDGSTDPYTIRKLRTLKKPKTRVIHQRNKGLPGARNTGIRHAKGKYIFPLDADDTIKPTLLEKAVSILEKRPRLGVVSCWLRCFGDSNFVWRQGPYKFKTLLRKNLLISGSLFRRVAWKQVGGYNEAMIRGYEDWDFWISMGARGWGGYIIREELYNYRRHGRTMLVKSSKIHSKLVRQIRRNHPNLYHRMVRNKRK